MIQIKLEECPLEISYKLQMISARSFKELQIIESNSYVIKLSLNFNISSTFYMKDLIIYKIQQSICDDHIETIAPLSLSLAQKEHTNATLDALVVFTKDDELQRIPLAK